MATLTQIIQISLEMLAETERKFGDKRTPIELTVDGQVYDTGNVTIADNFGTAVLWDATAGSNGGISSFDHLFFTSNADVWIELVNTVPATDERAYIFVPANTYLVLPSRYIGALATNTSRLDGANLVEATDFDEITQIKVQRDEADGVGDATVRLMLVN